MHVHAVIALRNPIMHMRQCEDQFLDSFALDPEALGVISGMRVTYHVGSACAPRGSTARGPALSAIASMTESQRCRSVTYTEPVSPPAYSLM